VDEGLVYEREATDEWGHVFSTRIVDEEVVQEVGHKNHECSRDHGVQSGEVDNGSHFYKVFYESEGSLIATDGTDFNAILKMHLDNRASKSLAK
jgi:hypothetical protein